MIPILQVFYSVFSGILLAAAIPNEIFLFGCPLLSLIALIPFYLVFKNINNYKAAFVSGFIQTIVTHLISSFWLAFFKDYAIFTLGASALGTGLIGGFVSLFFYLPYAQSSNQNKLNENSLSSGFFNSVIFRVLYFSAIYSIYEWVKSSGFLGYPWGTVSSTIFRWPVLMQLSSITGTWGITFFICSINAILAEAFLIFKTNFINKQTRMLELKQTVNIFLIFTVLIFTHGIYQYYKVRNPHKYLTTILVQQNSDPWKQVTDDETILISQKLTQEQIQKLDEEDKKPDLVVWSEGCLQKYFPGSVTHYNYYPEESPLLPFIQKTQTPFILGGGYVKDKAKKQYFNASILIDENGKYRGVYGKNHLVPFAEALPFMEIPAVKNFMNKVVGISAGWTPGDQYVFFNIPCKVTEHFKLPAVSNVDLLQTYEEQSVNDKKPFTVKIATPICFDDAFSDIMRPLFLNGAELFVNITDDSWSLKSSSELQHFVIASYSAIEYRTTLVRSANAGYSVVVTPAGKVIGSLPLFEQVAESFEVPVYKRTMTTYARFGNWFVYLLILLVCIYSLYCYFNFCSWDYIPSERKIHKSKKKSKKHSKKKSKK